MGESPLREDRLLINGALTAASDSSTCDNITPAPGEVIGVAADATAHDAEAAVAGLSGAVVSSDVQRAQRVASRLRTGTVSVNGAQWYGPDVPFGGYKQSGLGREAGVAGFEEYLETKSVAIPG